MGNKISKLAKANSPGMETEYQEPPYEIESGMLKFARMELQMLCAEYQTKDNPPIVKPFINEILALVNKFGHSGQSGGSASMVASAISQTIFKLMSFMTLLPITGRDEEWADVREYGGKMVYQNKRLSSIFKDIDGKCSYLDAILFRTQNNTTCSSQPVKRGDGLVIGTKQYIKSFPFEPKTFVIDVIETEVEKDNWDFSIKYESQLTEVFEYYDFYPKGY